MIKIVTRISSYISLLFLFYFIPTMNLVAETLIEYLSPRPGAQFVSEATTIAVRYKNQQFSHNQKYDSFFHIQGDMSGTCSGTVTVSDDETTLIFKPNHFFKPTEKVTVSVPRQLSSWLDTNGERKTYSFSISASGSENLSIDTKPDLSTANSTKTLHKATDDSSAHVRIINGVSVPYDFPTIDISVNDNPSPGHIFMNTWGAVPYVMILDNDGTPLYYKRMQKRPYDFKLQPTGALTHFQHEDIKSHIVMDSTYTVIDTVGCANGYTTDNHDFHILPNGNYLLIAMHTIRTDLSDVVEGGNPNALVTGNHIQELDASKNVIFEWRCWDYYKLTDANHADLTASVIDFTHINAVDVDNDGNLIISARNLSEITKIDRKTGDIIWRFGGVNSDFSFVNDSTGFSYQHCIRSLPNGHYILFDNGSYRGTNPRYSRAVEYTLDENNKTATLVWEYRHDPDIFSDTYGNAQRLENGNTLINYGHYGTPKFIEVKPNGEKTFELDFIESAESYRSYRFDWQGKAAVSYLIAESHQNFIRLFFNKFGDFDIKEYRVYGGNNPNPTTVMATVEQPYIDIKTLANNDRHYFRVTAVNNANQESNFSNEVFVDPHFTEPGGNKIRNGNFSDSTKFWDLQLNGYGRATGNVTNPGEYVLDIQNSGTASHDIMLVQNDIELIENGKYCLSITASAENSRIISIHLCKIYEPWTDYSQIGYCQITRQKQTQTFEFVMHNKSDYQSQLVLECGGSSEDITFSDISLCRTDVSYVNQNPITPFSHSLSDNYPNPFNPVTTIHYSLPQRSFVTLNVYNVLGKNVATLVNEAKDAGTHRAIFDASFLSSGVYFYRLLSNSGSLTKQMLVLK